MRNFVYCFIYFFFIIVGCNKDDDNKLPTVDLDFNFQYDNEGWAGGFADYPDYPDVENYYELQFSHSTLPAPLNISDGALKQSGFNHSDDLFMFVKKRITGLEPDKNYSVDIEIEIASNVRNNSIGAGGSPGESVYVKAGASTVEPIKVLDNYDNHFRMNIDKGNQSVDGANMKNIGNFANGTDMNIYTLKTLKNTSPINVQSDSNGEIWLIVGTDSGFEATTTIYYNSIKATIR
jgi:hypothetical protein